MATLDAHLSALFGDLVLRVAKQAAEIDALREALVAEQAKPKAAPEPSA